MNLHALRVFYTVAKLGSFSGAAEALFISQPAVSKALKELEHQLNIQLIERASKGKKLTLSEGGQALFEHARSIFAIEKAAIDDIKSRTGLKRGTLVIGASTTIASYWLPPYLANFCTQYPHIKVEVQVANTAHIEQALRDCTIDLALVEGTPTEPHIISKHWQNDKMSIVIPSTFTPDKNLQRWLSKQNWLLREPGSGTLEISSKLLTQHAVKVEESMQLGSNEAIARAVAQGMGVALLPNVVTEDLVQLGKLKRVSQQNKAPLSRPLYQLHYKDRPSSHAAQAFEKNLFNK
ncbi:LysR family transcriptional regulator [Pseudoalteromonas sp. MMG010]|uniref:LysR family transcriptional regulator n=1 Tax=Pseudoalteromonas sp. MMG010 TaxID=2822685 RepID=UPI001B3A1AE4|nr:LysR substrate-binding domain-containing protein [Pseudoalteromonas sp. MMG010]MBQ4833544.1 LysR family transcriptional regulator [Pseudoalteromonas sp. MMG010]